MRPRKWVAAEAVLVMPRKKVMLVAAVELVDAMMLMAALGVI